MMDTMSEHSNAVIEQMHKHASVRRFKPDAVSRAMIEEIVHAGLRAATSSNLHSWSAVAVTEAGTRTTLAALCGHQAQIAEAPVFVAWCADLSKLDRACDLRGLKHEHDGLENFVLGVVDAALAMQNASVAAESLGLGICYIGGIRNQPLDVARLLKLPRLVFPVSGMTIGWPVSPARIRPRMPLQGMLHWEHYSHEHTDAAISEMDNRMIASGVYQGRQVPVPGKPSQQENYGWTEHSARRVSEKARPNLLAEVRAQGFGIA